jgi:hypothetical protein
MYQRKAWVRYVWTNTSSSSIFQTEFWMIEQISIDFGSFETRFCDRPIQIAVRWSLGDGTVWGTWRWAELLPRVVCGNLNIGRRRYLESEFKIHCSRCPFFVSMHIWDGALVVCSNLRTQVGRITRERLEERQMESSSLADCLDRFSTAGPLRSKLKFRARISLSTDSGSVALRKIWLLLAFTFRRSSSRKIMLWDKGTHCCRLPQARSELCKGETWFEECNRALALSRGREEVAQWRWFCEICEGTKGCLWSKCKILEGRNMLGIEEGAVVRWERTCGEVGWEVCKCVSVERRDEGRRNRNWTGNGKARNLLFWWAVFWVDCDRREYIDPSRRAVILKTFKSYKIAYLHEVLSVTGESWSGNGREKEWGLAKFIMRKRVILVHFCIFEVFIILRGHGIQIAIAVFALFSIVSPRHIFCHLLVPSRKGWGFIISILVGRGKKGHARVAKMTDRDVSHSNLSVKRFSMSRVCDVSFAPITLVDNTLHCNSENYFILVGTGKKRNTRVRSEKV